MQKKIFFLFIILILLANPLNFLRAEEVNMVDDSGVDIPYSLQNFFKLIFHLEDINFKEVVIMSSLLLLAILIAYQGISIGTENKTLGLSLAIIICLIGSATGAMNFAMNLWGKFGEFAKIPEKFGIVWTTLGIVLLIIIFLALKFVENKTGEDKEIIDAKKLGWMEGIREARNKIKIRFMK